MLFYYFQQPDDIISLEPEKPETEEEEDAFDEKPKVPIILAKKAFKKWKDHRPTFDEMHSEDQKRRPRWGKYF